MNPSPKSKFLAVKDNIRKHQDLVDGEFFNHVVDVAMLQFQANVTEGEKGDVNAAAAKYFIILGAQQIVHLIKTLSDEQKAPKMPSIVQNLDHSIR